MKQNCPAGWRRHKVEGKRCVRCGSALSLKEFAEIEARRQRRRDKRKLAAARKLRRKGKPRPLKMLIDGRRKKKAQGVAERRELRRLEAA